jgi:5,10-methenyltetrahydrofolate synthetase
MMSPMNATPIPPDVATWRKERRAELIARRMALTADEQRRSDERITDLLVHGFPHLRDLTIGFYWPFNGEVDPRVAVHRFRTQGARTALPVVIAKATPLEFREWTPGVATQPGVFGLPVPQSPKAVPDVLLMPPVGVDMHGYRLGYGGGYFDRTLASLTPQPLKIGLAREVSRIDTIHPQPHDVPMDFVITEGGIHEVTDAGLRLVEELGAVDARARRIREQRLNMSAGELTAFLNTLLEAERAGAKVISAYLDEIALAPDARARLLEVQRDESRNSAVLIGLLRRVSAEPTRGTGQFLQMALAVQGDRARLEFLNRGQAWVARRIAAALPRISDAFIRDEMQAMHDSHILNIGVCDALLEKVAL